LAGEYDLLNVILFISDFKNEWIKFSQIHDDASKLIRSVTVMLALSCFYRGSNLSAHPEVRRTLTTGHLLVFGLRNFQLKV
jgi:hypothetical protein